MVQKGYSKDKPFKLQSKLEWSIKRYQEGKINNGSKFVQKFPQRFNSFESKTSNIKTITEKIIRKIKAGKRDSSQKKKQLNGAIDFWCIVKKWKAGRNSSRQII